MPNHLVEIFEDEVILDPFMGSGQSALAAIKTKRNFVGYEISEEYVKLAERRIREFLSMQSSQELFEVDKRKKIAENVKYKK